MELDDQILFTNMLEKIRIKNREKQELIIKNDKNKSIFITKEFYDKLCIKFKIFTSKLKLEI